MERLGLPFTVAAPDVDESRRTGEPPLSLVSRLARAKAQRIADRDPSAWVIGSDQVAVLGGDAATARVLGKPGTVAACIEQLESSSGQCVRFLTAVALVCGAEGAAVELVDTTRVVFRDLDRAAIERYVAWESPLDCAGGFKSEGLGISLLEAIETTDPTALVGLPLIRLAAALRNVGYALP